MKREQEEYIHRTPYLTISAIPRQQVPTRLLNADLFLYSEKNSDTECHNFKFLEEHYFEGGMRRLQERRGGGGNQANQEDKD